MEVKTAAPSNRKQVTVTKQQAGILHQQAKAFQQTFEKEKSQFTYSEDTIYYIVSSQFLSEWRDYATAHTLQRYLPAPMNIDILDNGKLKQDLKQGEDFEFLSENLYRSFAKYEGIQLKRKAVMIGTEKRIPVYLNEYKYLTVLHQTLRSIDRSGASLKQLETHSVQASQQSTIQDFLEQVRAKQRYSVSKQLRMWKIGKKTLEEVFQYIKKQTNPIRSYDYKIKFLGKKITEDKAKLGDMEFEEDQFIVVEVKDDMKKWHLFADTEGKCEGCYSITQLKVICGCKNVAYCSEQCQEKDKRFHLRNCDFAEMQEMMKPVQMKLTETSAKGRVGLSNLGNTCFMNSCLQCLSNTYPLTEYFLSGYFQKQINRVNPIGTKGKLAKTYAKFIKSMWCDSNTTFSPYNIKNAVSSINAMFSGYAQHDSQQFFSFLVDGLHEDLNRIEKKPAVQSVDSNGRPDSVVALQSWIAHTKRNQSVIVDLMTGQYRSKVTCPDCYRESITFDPFITVTLPIPQRVVSSHMFYLIHADMYKKTERYYLSYEKVKAQDWIASASKVTGLTPQKFFLYAVSLTQGLYKVGRQSTAEILHKVESENKNLFLIELSQEDLSLKNPMQVRFRFAKKATYDFDNLWFKFPFFFEKGEITGNKIYTKILKFLYGQAYIYNQNTQKTQTSYEQYEKQMLEKYPFKIYLKYNRKLERTYHRLEFTYEDQKEISYEDEITEFLQKQPLGDCEIDIRFYTRASLEQFDFEKLKDFDEVMKKPKAQTSQEVTVSIDHCFHHFREVEKLQAGNEWYCSKCKQHKQANKQLSIYKAPKVLILHLKRFKQKGMMRKQKNESKVQFPMELNMKEYLIDPSPMSSYIQELKQQNVYVEPKVDKPVIASDEPIYELYAVSNHYGGLGGGHYTAYAKNNGKWFEFNDSSVRACSQGSVSGSGAYILFYKRKE